MNLQELTRDVAERLKLTQAVARDTVHAVLTGVIDGLIKDGHVRLGELGIFEVKERKARVSRNPRTGGKLLVAKKQAVVFRPASELKTHLTKRPMTSGPDGEVESQKDIDNAQQAVESFLNAAFARNPEAGKWLGSQYYSTLAGEQDGTPVLYPEQKEKVAEAIHGHLGGDFERCSIEPDWELSGGGVRFSAVLERGAEKRIVALVLRRSQGAWKIDEIASR